MSPGSIAEAAAKAAAQEARQGGDASEPPEVGAEPDGAPSPAAKPVEGRSGGAKSAARSKSGSKAAATSKAKSGSRAKSASKAKSAPRSKAKSVKTKESRRSSFKSRWAAAQGKGAGKGKVFAGRRVMPGDSAQIHLKVSETVTHQPARIPVTVIRGERPGPTLFLTAAVHGDEINGVAVVREVLDQLDVDRLSGTLVGMPVVNRFGFATGDRYLPDRRDLNRFFPGDPDRTMPERIADVLFRKVISKCDAGIDLHTAATGRANLCHVRGDASDQDVRELMRGFGTPILMDDKGPKGSLRRAATDAGIPTIIFEAGEPGRFQPHVVDIGSQGIFRIMKHMGIWDKRVRRNPGFQVLVKKTEWVRSTHGGILDLLVEPGDLVQTRQRVAIIHDPFGRHVDEIKATHSGVVLGTNTTPLTNPGQAIVHIGHLHKTLQRARDYVKRGGDLGHVNWPAKPPSRPKKKRKPSTGKKQAK